MHPEQIKAAIRMTGTTPAVLAEELGLSRSTLSQVINGRGTSARVKAHIAKVTGLSVNTLWPSKPDPTVLRRAAPAQKSVESERREQARRDRERREQERRDGERRAGAAA